jgi:putative Ca2+/H+ antiporter (TMEM165/GDT1 family)
MSDIWSAFGIVFLAELGDKTQLLALAFAARHRVAPVAAGVAIGYATVNLVSVAIGGVAGAALPTRPLAVGAGLLFLAFAAVTLLRGNGDTDPARDPEPRLDPGQDPASGQDPAPAVTAPGAGRSSRSVVATVAAAMFVAELGDKTMLATATLAARGNPALVWIGATAGIVVAGGLGIAGGRGLGSRLPARALRLTSAALFAAFGVIVLASQLT